MSISDGVIVLEPSEEVFYGGNLKSNLADITSYEITFYIASKNNDKILLSNKVEDMTGETINIGSEIGKRFGDVLNEDELDELQNNLYFELKATDLEGKESVYTKNTRWGISFFIFCNDYIANTNNRDIFKNLMTYKNNELY